jgi:hypothetical protein
MGESGPEFPADLVEFLESGVSILVGTRNADLRPASARAMGARVEARSRKLTVYLPEAVSATTLANLRDNASIAVTFSRPLTHHSMQLKGRVLSVRPSDEADRAVQRAYRAAYGEQLDAVGLPRNVSSRIVWWPSVAIEVSVGDVFIQTPGPSAGRPLAV